MEERPKGRNPKRKTVIGRNTQRRNTKDDSPKEEPPKEEPSKEDVPEREPPKGLWPNLQKAIRIKILRICPACKKRGALVKRHRQHFAKKDLVLDALIDKGDYVCKFCGEEVFYSLK
jgi:hypothetical protein